MSIALPARVDTEIRQRFAETTESPAHPRLDRPDRLAELRRDLGLTIARRVQGQDGALRLWQEGERIGQPRVADRAPGVGRRLLARVDAFGKVIIVRIGARRA